MEIFVFLTVSWLFTITYFALTRLPYLKRKFRGPFDLKTFPVRITNWYNFGRLLNFAAQLVLDRSVKAEGSHENRFESLSKLYQRASYSLSHTESKNEYFQLLCGCFGTELKFEICSLTIVSKVDTSLKIQYQEKVQSRIV